jgi:DnaJ-class molecular chaperone
LRGLGAPDVDKGGSGDLYVEVKMEIPGKLTEAQKQLIETLKKEGL